MDPLYVGARGETRRKTSTAGAFVWGVKALGMGDDGQSTPRAFGSVQQKRWQQRIFIVCMYASYAHNTSLNCPPIAASLSVDGSHTLWGPRLFLLTSNLCWELASDKMYRHWHGNSTEAWMLARKCPHLPVLIAKDLFWLWMLSWLAKWMDWDCWWFFFDSQGHLIFKNSIITQQEVFSHRVILVVDGSIMEISFGSCIPRPIYLQPNDLSLVPFWPWWSKSPVSSFSLWTLWAFWRKMLSCFISFNLKE